MADLRYKITTLPVVNDLVQVFQKYRKVENQAIMSNNQSFSLIFVIPTISQKTENEW